MSSGRVWTEEDCNYIRNNYGHTSLKELMKILGRSANAVQKKASKLGVSKIMCYSRWSHGRMVRKSRPIGSTRIDKNGYTQIKIGERDWRLLQRVKWEEYYGTPPDGTVAFKDGNRANFEKPNLYLTSPKEQLKKNTANNLPQDLKELIRLKGTLTFMINKRSVK